MSEKATGPSGQSPDDLRRENRRLRDALRRLVIEIEHGHFGEDPYYRDVQRDALDAARAALMERE